MFLWSSQWLSSHASGLVSQNLVIISNLAIWHFFKQKERKKLIIKEKLFFGKIKFWKNIKKKRVLVRKFVRVFWERKLGIFQWKDKTILRLRKFCIGHWLTLTIASLCIQRILKMIIRAEIHQALLSHLTLNTDKIWIMEFLPHSII